MSLDIQSLRHIVNHQNREFERAIHLQVLKVYINRTSNIAFKCKSIQLIWCNVAGLTCLEKKKSVLAWTLSLQGLLNSKEDYLSL